MYKQVAHRTAKLMCRIPEQIFPPSLPSFPVFEGTSEPLKSTLQSIFGRIYPTLRHSVRIRLEDLDVPRYKGGRSQSRKMLAQHSAQWIYGLTNKYALETAYCRGIQLHFVDPAYTSQACPTCGIIGHKGYFVKVDLSSSSVTPIKIDKNWVALPQTDLDFKSLDPDTTSKLTLTPNDMKRILVYAQEETSPSKTMIGGFYIQKGGTAFRCNNPLCRFYGHVLGRDVVGARNIALKNSSMWSLNRIRTHWTIISQSNRPTIPNIPIWPKPGNWSSADRIKKIIGDISFLKAKYHTVYTLFDPHQYTPWFRTNAKSMKWKRQMETLQEFRLWTHSDWNSLDSVLQDSNFRTIQDLDWNQKMASSPQDLLMATIILGGFTLESQRNFLIWKEIQNLLDDTFFPSKK